MRNNLAEKIILESGGIARTAALNAGGIENYEISRLCSNGYIRRIRHGYYSLHEVPDDTILSAVLPEGIICMQSALSHYGYCESPDVWSVAVPRSLSRSKLYMECIDFKPYFIRSEFFDIGRTEDMFDSVSLPVYDRERTICDMFRYRRKMDSDIFAAALYSYAVDEKKNLERLEEYSRLMHIEDKVRDAIEIVLASPPLSIENRSVIV